MLWTHRKVHRAIKRGLLVALVDCGGCEGCGLRRASVYHHHDYTLPLDVIPLCLACHVAVHHGWMAEPRTGRIYSIEDREHIRRIRKAERDADREAWLRFKRQRDAEWRKQADQAWGLELDRLRALHGVY